MPQNEARSARPDTGLDHFLETYRRIGVTMSLVMRIFDKTSGLTYLTILFQNKTPPAEDADTPTRRHVSSLLRQLINLRSQHEIQVSQSARRMRGQHKLHRIPSDVDIRVMIHSLRFFRQLVYELNRG